MKTRLFRTVVAFLFAGLALTQVGCYDQQIEDLNNRIDELTTGKIASIESQYSSLQTTLASLKSASDAMASKNAALEATIKSIEGTLDGFMTKSQLDATLASYATVAQLGELTAALDGVEDAAVKAAVEAAVKAAGDALEESFQTKFDAAFAKATGDLTAEVEKKLEAAVADLDKKIADAVAEAMKNNGEVSTEDLCEASKVVKQFLSGRLTSLLLIPELYVDGIETIEVEMLEYYEWTKDAKAEAYEQDNLAPWTTSYVWKEIQYTVGPKVVNDGDIETPSFVFNDVETRALLDPEFTLIPAEYEELFGYAPYEINGGVLTVRGVKRAASIDVEHPAGAERAWIGALEAPIAAKHLMEDEAGAVVRSDWAKFIQVNYVPSIAALIDLNEGLDPNAKPSTAGWSCTLQDHYHFSATYEDAMYALPSQVAPFNEALNLTEMVTGCVVNQKDGSVKEFTKDEIAKSGLKFEFYIPTEPYLIGSGSKADQQKFAKIVEENGAVYAKSRIPDADMISEASVGRTPIVCVKLVDTNNNNAIVDVRYFKIQWTQVEAKPIDLGVIKTFDYTLCNCDLYGIIDWNDVVNTILNRTEWSETGISYAELFEYYAWYNITSLTSKDHQEGEIDIRIGEPADVIINDIKTSYPELEFVHNFDLEEESNNAMIWHLNIYQIGNVIDDLRAGKEVKRTLTVTLNPANENHGMYGDLSFSFEANIKLPKLAALNDNLVNTFWYAAANGNVARVFPVQYDTTHKGIEHYGNGDGKTVIYDYPLHKLFYQNTEFLKYLLPCSMWDLFFGSTKEWEVTRKTQDFNGNVHVKTVANLGVKATNGDIWHHTPWKIDMKAWEKVWYDLQQNWAKCDGKCEVDDETGAKIGKAEAWLELVDGPTTYVGDKPIFQELVGEQLLIYDKDGNKQTETIEFRGHLNSMNSYEIKGFTIEYVRPLNIEMAGALEFTDQLTTGDKQNYHKLIKITDCFGEVVDAMPDEKVLGKEKAALARALANYYVVEDYIVDWDNATIVNGSDAGKKAEDVFAPEDDKEWYKEATDGSDNVTFYNWSGVKVEHDCQLEADVTIYHKWGTEVVKMTINIKSK